jgi:hypothetical protein
MAGIAAGAVAIAMGSYLLGAERGHAQPPRSSTAVEGNGVTPNGPRAAYERPTTLPAASPAIDNTSSAAGVAPSSRMVALPIPASLGGGKPVTSQTRSVAERLGLVPEALASVAEAHGGTLPAAVVRKLDDAYAQGLALGQRVGLEAPKDEICANRFANQLVRIDIEMHRSPPSTTLADVVNAVTSDTITDLRRTLGDDVAGAAAPELAKLAPL